VSWELLFGREARKDAKKIQRAGLQAKVDALLNILESDPFRNPPAYERLMGDLDGYYSRRINIQHRLVYRVDKGSKRVLVDRMWTHYE
jgi:toxin YoeB